MKLGANPKRSAVIFSPDIASLDRADLQQLFLDWISKFDFSRISGRSEEIALRSFYNQANSVAPELGRPERLDFFGVLDRSAFLNFPITMGMGGDQGYEALAVLSLKCGNREPFAGPFGYLRDLRIQGGSRCFARWRRIYRSLLEHEELFSERFGFRGFYTLVASNNERWRDSLPLLESYGIHYNEFGRLNEYVVPPYEGDRTFADCSIESLESEPEGGAHVFTAYDLHVENFSSFESYLQFQRECSWVRAQTPTGDWVAAWIWNSSNTKLYPIDGGKPRHFLIDLISNTSAEYGAYLLSAIHRANGDYALSLPGFPGVEQWLRFEASVQEKLYHLYRVEKSSRSYAIEQLTGLSAFI